MRRRVDGVNRFFPLLCLGVLIVLAGCSVGPFGEPEPQEEPVRIYVNNSANVTHLFGVLVIELPANFTAHRNDGLTGSSNIGRGLGGHSPGENYTYTSVGSLTPLGFMAITPLNRVTKSAVSSRKSPQILPLLSSSTSTGEASLNGKVPVARIPCWPALASPRTEPEPAGPLDNMSA